MSYQVIWDKNAGAKIGSLPSPTQGGTLEVITILALYRDGSTIDLSAMTLSATMTNRDSETTAVTGTLAGANGSFTWDFSAGDIGTPGRFSVVVAYTDGAESWASMPVTMDIIANPAATAVQNPALVGVSTTDAAWLTAGAAGGALSAQLAATQAAAEAASYPAASGATLAAALIPVAIADMTATTSSSTEIDLAWTYTAVGYIAGFYVYRKTGIGGTYALIDTIASTETSYADTGLTANTEYYYRVDAYNNFFTTAGNEANATTEPVTYMIIDEFTTAASAPLTSPRTAEPGPGTLTLVQTDGQFSIVDGVLQIPAQTTPDQASLGFYTGTYAREAGRFVYGKLSRSGAGNDYYPYIAWGSSAENLPASINNPELSAAFTINGNISTIALGTNAYILFETNVDYEFLLMLRGTGGFIFARGGLFSTWQLLTVKTTGTGATLRPTMNTYTGPASTMSAFLVGDLEETPYQSDYGIATNRIASPSDGEITTSEADAIIEFTWTAATGETLELDTRRIDNDNRWIVRCSQAGSTVKLIERNAGAETERFSAAQTFTNGTPYRIVVRQIGIRIDVTINATFKNAYDTSPFNSAATGVKVSGFTTGSELQAWPLRVSLPVPENGVTNRIATIGDSKTTMPTSAGRWQPVFLAAVGAGWNESYRLGRGGAGVVNMPEFIAADAAREPTNPDYILVNIGVNDLGGVLTETQWRLQFAAILDNLHTKWPDALVYCAKPWKRGQDATSLTMADWIDAELATRSAWAFVGLNEYVIIRAADDGAAYTTDGIHYSNPAGNAAAAAGWIAAMGI